MEETVAYIAIRRLQNRYADIITRRAWPELEEVIRRSCVVTVNTVDQEMQFPGPRSIGDFIRKQLEKYDFFEFVILNTVMDIDAGQGRATARMYIQEARQEVAGGRRSDSFGVYHDAFDRDPDGRWWFAERYYQRYARTNPPDSSSDLTVYDLPERPL